MNPSSFFSNGPGDGEPVFDRKGAQHGIAVALVMGQQIIKRLDHIAGGGYFPLGFYPARVALDAGDDDAVLGAEAPDDCLYRDAGPPGDHLQGDVVNVVIAPQRDGRGQDVAFGLLGRLGAGGHVVLSRWLLQFHVSDINMKLKFVKNRFSNHYPYQNKQLIFVIAREVAWCEYLTQIEGGIYTICIYKSGGEMNTAKLFISGNSQAVRLPKEYRFEGTEVFIKRVGNAVILLPYHEPWQSLIESLDEFPDDFMEARDQPADQEREPVFP